MKFCETNVFSCLSVTLVAEIEITIDFLKKGPYPNIVFREISLTPLMVWILTGSVERAGGLPRP